MLPNNGLAIHIALVEPNEADVYWFDIVAKQIQVPITIVRYATELAALEEWGEHEHSPFDLIVVAETLPMLTIPEFMDRAKAVLSDMPIVVGERASGPRLRLDGIDRYTKPLCEDDVQDMLLNAPRYCPHQTKEVAPTAQ